VANYPWISAKKARSHVKKGKITEAQKLYQAVLLAFPKNIRAQQGLTALNKLSKILISKVHLKK